MHPAHALLLGEVRGAAILGRPLDITVQVQRGPTEEDFTVECFSVDLYFADARQQPPTVSIVPSGAAKAVRIRSLETVNEPVVTVLLAAACGTGAMRRYLLLADIPMASAPPPTKAAAQPAMEKAPAPPPSAVVTPGIPQESPVLVLPENRPASAAVAPVAPTEQPWHRKPRKPAMTPAAPADSPAKPPKQETAQPPALPPVPQNKKSKDSRPVLRLDPAGVFSDRIGSLHAPMSFAPTEDTLLHAKQIASLQDDVQSLRSMRQSDQAQIAQLRAELELLQRGKKADSSSPASFGWSGMALWLFLLATLAGAAWFWRTRGGRYQAWWHGGHDFGDLATIFQPRPAESEAPPPFKATLNTEGPHTVAELPPENPPEPPVPSTPVPSPTPPAIAQPATANAVPETSRPRAAASTGEHRLTSEYILDIRQQADFFVSLGQSERAIDILAQQIHGNPHPDPLVFLDLLGLYHTLGAKADFAMEAASFTKHFHCAMPDFAQFGEEGDGLESYPEVLSKIVRLWPNPSVMVLLDHCIYRTTDSKMESFAIGAFRELLTLRALAEGLDQQSASGTEDASVATATNVPPMERTIPLPRQDNANHAPLDFDKTLAMPRMASTHPAVSTDPHADPHVSSGDRIAAGAQTAPLHPGLAFTLDDASTSALPTIAPHQDNKTEEDGPGFDAEAPPPSPSLFAALPNSFFDVEEDPAPHVAAPEDIARLFAQEPADPAPPPPSIQSNPASALSFSQPKEEPLETPSRMLDLDFSHLTGESQEITPPKHPYAQRSTPLRRS